MMIHYKIWNLVIQKKSKYMIFLLFFTLIHVFNINVLFRKILYLYEVSPLVNIIQFNCLLTLYITAIKKYCKQIKCMPNACSKSN